MNSISGYRLLSKPGRTSLNRFKILSEKDEILHNSIKKLKKAKSFDRKKKLVILDELKNKSISRSKETLERNIKTNLESPKNFVPKLKSASNTNLGSSLNIYDYILPSFKSQERHIPTIKFKQIPSEVRKKAEKVVKIHKHPSGKTKKKIIPGVSFKKQLPRNMLWIYHNVNEKRFESSRLPLANTQVPDFEKQSSRPLFYKYPISFPDYNPNKECVQKKISHNIVFDKFLKRDVSYNNHFLPDPYDVNYSSIDPKSRSYKFKL